MANSITIDEQKQRRDSMSISLVLHLFLLLLLLIPIVQAFSKQPEPPQFQGIQVALGYKAAKERTKTNPAPSAAETKPVAKPTETKAKPKTKPSSAKPKASKAVAKKVVSKTREKEAPIVATKKKVVEKKVNKKSDAEIAKEKAEAEAKAKAEAEAEAKRKAAEEAKRKAAEKAAKAAAAKSAAKSKFNNLMKSANGDGAPSKGDPSGHPDASALEGITKGKGKAGNGLGNRGLLHAPEISDNTQRTGRVVVNICVNSKGKVISANYTQKGSTTTDSHLIDLATNSALKYRFSASTTEEQCGDITIDFRLK